jgi:outer membrane protein OmpA-like peptidoglycan-associated protein
MRAPFAVLALGLASAAFGGPLDGELETWLRARFPEALAAVQQVDEAGVRTVVHVFPRDGARAPTNADAAELVQGLRRGVLDRVAPGQDFAAGSQFLLFGPEQVAIAGAGPELRQVLEELARVVVADAGRMGLGVLHIALTGFGGPMAGVEVRARGVNLGEAGRREAQRQLDRHLRDVVFGERYPWVAYLEEQSRVEVVDVQLPEPVAPTSWRYDPSREIVGRPTPGAPRPPAPATRPTAPVAARPTTPGAGPSPPVGTRDPALVTVYFDTDRSELRPGDRASLRALVSARSPSATAAVVVGHADSRNTRSYNQALGLRRARSVGKFLRELGVPRGRLELHSHGEDRPAVPNDTPENMQRNRRALVQVLD